MDLYNIITTGSMTNMGNLYTSLLFCACAVVLLGDLKASLKGAVVVALEFAFMLVLETVLEVVIYSFTGSSVTFPALFGALGVYALMQRKLTLTDRIVRVVTFASAFVLIVSMVGVMRAAFPVIKRLDYGQWLPSALSYVLMVVFAVVLRRFSIRKFLFVPQYFVLLIVLVDIFGASAGYSFISYSITHMTELGDTYASVVLTRYEQSVSMVNVLVDTTFLLIMLASYVMFYVLAREHDQRAELLVVKRNEVDNAAMSHVTQESYERLREIRHEIKNHDAYLAALLKEGDYDTLSQVFAAQQAERAEFLYVVSTGNRTVDAVVNAKITHAKKQGVEIKTMLAVPKELPFAEDDLFSLLANLLDNAVEGTLASSSPHGPVTLKVMPEAGYYVFTVTNPANAKTIRRDRAGELLTSKSDKDVHGYGTRVIKGIAEKYEGAARFTVKGGEFCASVMLSQGASARREPAEP